MERCDLDLLLHNRQGFTLQSYLALQLCALGTHLYCMPIYASCVQRVKQYHYKIYFFHFLGQRVSTASPVPSPNSVEMRQPSSGRSPYIAPQERSSSRQSSSTAPQPVMVPRGVEMERSFSSQSSCTAPQPVTVPCGVEMERSSSSQSSYTASQPVTAPYGVKMRQPSSSQSPSTKEIPILREEKTVTAVSSAGMWLLKCSSKHSNCYEVVEYYHNYSNSTYVLK